jgi:3-hydroxybutyryl-CoA dehydratase
MADVLDVALFARAFDDLSEGERFTTRGRTITEADVVNFAGFSGDWNPHHVDAEFARGTPFGQRIAHGMGVLAIGMGLLPIDIARARALTGVDAVRFRRPVFIGATVRATGCVEALVERDEDAGRVALALAILADGELAVTGRITLLWARSQS